MDFPVTLTWGRKHFRWRAREFSEYGILVAAGQKDLVGEDVQIALPLEAGASPLSLTGVVAYATGTGIGIRFKNVPQEQQNALKTYVEARGIGVVKR